MGDRTELLDTRRLMRSDPTLGMVRPKVRFDSYAFTIQTNDLRR
jgi:hypothetical protein